MTNNKFLKFDVKIRNYYGSTNTAIVFGRLLYWFTKKPDGFYKFKQACRKHPLYKVGDSWGEELGMSRKVLDPILNRLVNHHKTKRAYDQAEDKFQGKLFASYTNHKTSQTHYFVDLDNFNKFLAELNVNKQIIPSSPAEVTTEPKAAKIMPINRSSDAPFGHHLARAHLDQHNYQTITSLEDESISKKMVEIWNSQMRDSVIWYPGYAIKLCKALKEFFNNCLETFKRYCLTLASSDFLTGKAKNSNFKAFLFWSVKYNIIQAVMAGAYGVKDFFSIKTPEEKQLKEEIRSINTQIKNVDYQIAQHEKEIIEGQKKLIKDYKSALTEVELSQLREESDQEFYQNHPRDQVSNRFERMLLETHFEGFMTRKIRERLGLSENIITPQELLDQKSNLQAHLDSMNLKFQMLKLDRETLDKPQLISNYQIS